MKHKNLGQKSISIQKRYIIELIKKTLNEEKYDNDKLKYYWKTPIVEGVNLTTDNNLNIWKIIMGLGLSSHLVECGIQLDKIDFNYSTKSVSKDLFKWER